MSVPAHRFEELFDAFSRMRVGVIGDIMLDTYWWGHVDRISPEAPVPIVALDKKEHRIGGAGNVAYNLAALGATVSVLSVTGEDEEGTILAGLLQAQGIRTDHILRDPGRITTSKSRIISRNQQMMRLDSEVTLDLEADTESALLQNIRTYLTREKPQALIFEDYNKGVLTPRIIEESIRLCREQGILTMVDPKRKNFFAYRYVDIFKPNLKEVREALHMLAEEPDLSLLHEIHESLRQRLNHDMSLITLSEKGVYYRQGGRGRIIPSHIRNIADVSGAGDTVIAVASLVYAATRDADLMAEIANIAGGLVCEEVGTVAIDKSRLLEECRLLLRATAP